ncbi:DUF5591 domain-containing protein [Methanobrevibacter curvatus]|uniref:PUA domain protein n=1 Tax=Methanobrevibacter curvatus TaxID=49547 RepID=A0A166CNQ7_9EURY|nr:DUF5591 domain-containing protein [Methanobrevibacter curvatus]KZX14695.1 PUA domain protein [Methanobrevibacter curvatus]
MAKVICSSDESLYRPEVVRWRERMALLKPLGEVVVVLPCSMKKPYSNSKSHQIFKKASRKVQEVILTSPFGICPREMENTYPIQSYDVAVSGKWSNEEKKLAGKLLNQYLDGKDIIAHVSGGYEKVCQEYLDGAIYTCVDGKTTSPDSIYNLRMELKKYSTIKRREKVLNGLKSVAIYQFGENGHEFIDNDTIAKGKYHKKIIRNKNQIAILNNDRGFYSLTLKGGEILNDLGINIVEIDFELSTNTVFAPGINSADSNILPNDEVVVVRNGEVLGVGKAILSGKEMELATKGIGVKIRHRKK